MLYPGNSKSSKHKVATQMEASNGSRVAHKWEHHSPPIHSNAAYIPRVWLMGRVKEMVRAMGSPKWTRRLDNGHDGSYNVP